MLPFNAVKEETENRRWRVSGYSDKTEVPHLQVRFIAYHPSHHYVAFVFEVKNNYLTKDDYIYFSLFLHQKDTLKAAINEKGLNNPQTVVYSVLPLENMGLTLPKVDRLDISPTFFMEPKFAFDYPRDTFVFLDSLKIQVPLPFSCLPSTLHTTPTLH